MQDKSDLIHDLGHAIVTSEELHEINWDYLSLVISSSEGAIDKTGFFYINEEAQPFCADTEDPEELFTLFEEMSNILYEEEGNILKAVLIQISGSGKIETIFEYDDSDRWNITPNNIEEMQEKLRPNFIEKIKKQTALIFHL